jgi:hypothetical protein
VTEYEKSSLLLAIISAIIAGVAIVKSMTTAKDVHREQMLLSQRQLFITIWPKLAELSEINPARAVGVDVIKNVNVLELVALCWEGGMVDANVIRRAFGKQFVTMRDRIASVPMLPAPINKTGQDLLNENPAIGKLYDVLKRELQEHGAVPALSSGSR